MKKPFLILIIFASIHCLAQVSFNDLKGTWRFSSYEGTFDLVFQTESQLIFGGEPSAYTLTGNYIRIQDGYYTIDYPFVLQGNLLTVSFPEDYDLTFSKIENSDQVITEQNEKQQVYDQNQQKQTGGQEHLLNGKLCSWSGSSTSSSSYSSSSWAYFDGQGNFSYGSESSFSSDAGNAYGGDNGGSRGTYRISGDTIYFSYPDGSSDTATVYMRQDDGRITEVKYDGSVYAAGLCE